MSAKQAIRSIRAPGRMVVNPTEVFKGGTFPYGGVEVGKTSELAYVPLGTAMNVWYESTGSIGAVLEPSKEMIVTCFMRGWDDDAVEKLFAKNSFIGANSGHAGFEEGGSTTPGEDASPRALKIVYVPEDTLHVPAMMMYAAIPWWIEGGTQVPFQRSETLGIPMAFQCLDNGAGLFVRIARLIDISL